MPSSATSDKGSDKQGELALLQPTFRFRCIGCGSITQSAVQDFRCPQCGNLLEITDSSWNSHSPTALKSLWRERRTLNLPLDLSGVWRFRELLPAPASEQQVVTLREGNTPLYELPQSSRITSVPRLYAKHQGMNPTGSFKDAGMTVAATFARQAGYRWVACASTGNTSASMAAYAARGGMRSLVLVPEGKISWSKLSQALDYGALTCQLRTDFDGCLRLLQELVKRAPVYQLNSINPFRLEGQKTLAFELLEQLDWQPPDHIIVPGGNLGNSSAIGKALLEMLELGLIPRLPKLSVIQAEGANALFRTLREAGGKQLVSVQAETRATAIRIGNPASWAKAVKVLQATSGACEQVSELEIAQAKAEIGSEGIGCEPASAVTLAGLKNLLRQGFVKPEETVVLVLTGNLLKDPDFTMEFHRGDLFHGTAYEHESDSLNPFRHPPVVLDDHIDGRRTAAHSHADPRIPRVLQHVGERLLHDPVHRRTYRCRIRRRFAVDLQGDRETRRPDAVHEGGELGEAGLWFAQLIWLVLITHDVEEPAQLGQGLPAAAFDMGERLARPGRLVLENALGRYRLHDHHTDVVCDQVVQLPGDTDPFCCNRRPLRLFGLLSLGLQRARLTAALHREPDQPRGRHEQHEDGGRPQLLGGARQGIECDLHPEAGHSHQQARQGDAPRSVRRDGIRGGESGQQQRRALGRVGGGNRLHGDGRHQHAGGPESHDPRASCPTVAASSAGSAECERTCEACVLARLR